MNDINEEKINCQLLNLSNQNVLNCLECIAFNSNYTIVLTIQKQIINSYFFKNNYLKQISSINVLRNDKQNIKELEYLKASNSILIIASKKIQIANLNGLNERKFLLKIGIKLQDRFCKLLFNKTQSNLFLTQRNLICFFEQRINGWKCSQQFEVGYRDIVISMCLNFQEDELQICGYDSYQFKAHVYIYHKETQKQEIKWVLIQTICADCWIGKLWGGFEDHLYFFNNYALDVYKKSNQSQDYIKYTSSKFKTNPGIFWECVQNKFVLQIEEDNIISVMKINQQQQLDFIKQITIDMSALRSQHLTLKVQLEDIVNSR